MRFHVPALPHTRTPYQWSGAAYTAKTDNFARMMMQRGHEVFHYGAEEGPLCTEHVQVISGEEQRKYFEGAGFQWDADALYWLRTNERVSASINARKQQGDFLCLIGGTCQQPMTQAIGEDVMAVEIGIGYYGTFAKYRVFESYAHQALVYGQQSADPTPSLYDAVIPGYFDVATFPYCPTPDGYLLYVGRIIHRKGIDIAIATAKAAGMPLMIVGRGGRMEDGLLITEDGWKLPLHDGVTYLDHVTTEERNSLMGHATAVLMPTRYMECFGNVAIEAMLCGTPVISTDHGAFTETISHGVNGYRCHTLDQFKWAAKNAHLLDRSEVRTIAEANYGLDRASEMYQEYFSMLTNLWQDGWETPNPERTNLDWLNKL